MTQNVKNHVLFQETWGSVIDNAPVMLWLADADGNSLFFNQTWLQFTGYTLEHALACNWTQRLLHPQDSDHYQIVYQQALKAQKNFKIVYRLRTAHGDYCWLSESVQARFNSEKKFLGFIGACTDISEQKQVQQTAQESQRRLATLMSNLPGMVYRRRNDPYWTLEFVSEGCIQLTGYYPHQLINNKELTFADFVHPEDRERLWQLVQKAIKEQQPFKQEYRLYTADNQEKWVSEQGQGIFSSSGELQALEGFIIDITDKKNTEVMLNRAKQMAEDANLAKSQFLANMSHELRTPLNAIMGYSEILQEEAEDLMQEDFIPDLLKIRAAGRHLLNLISDILDISKIEAGRMELFVEHFLLDTITQEVITTIKPLMQQQQNTFEVCCQPDIGEVHLDLVKVRQILLNLLSNAAKFTQQGQVKLAVQRQTVPEGDWLILQVSDNGIGIKAEQQQRLFQIFMQADASTTRKYGGTGLGLAIIYQFVQMMHGHVEVKSVFGEGSTFTVRLPAHIPASPAQQRKPALTTYAPMPVKEGKVLVIDDDESVRALLFNYLTRIGYQVSVAANGEEGLKLAKQVHPHAITLDIMMPDMDGWTVLSALRAEPELAQVPVIIISMVEDKNIGYSLGATDFLMKPVSRDQLGTLLQKYHIGNMSNRVLVIESEPEARALMVNLLTKTGCEVFQAEQATQALKLLEQQSLDLILLDLVLPEMEGVELAEKLHKNWHEIPIIALTGKEISAEERTQLRPYVQTILHKNTYHHDQLLVEIRELLMNASQKYKTAAEMT
ncbi:MAG: response regulator [Pseudomonadota bacterium]|nr:response regulator [Pseudomonadota bacterium]